MRVRCLLLYDAQAGFAPRVSGTRRRRCRTAANVTLGGIPDSQENAGAQYHIAAVKERVLLKLLVTGGVVAVSLGRIDHSSASDALRFVGKAKYPPETDDACDNDQASHNAHLALSD